MSLNAPHISVLRDEAIAALAIRPGETHIDATFGAGGYSRAMLAGGAIVHAIDRDPDAARFAEAVAAEHPGHFHFHAARFSQIAERLAQLASSGVDGMVFDIGVSSMQLDRAERGFSMKQDGPLDMRMAQSGETAAEFLNSADADVIADILYHYGEERQSRRIATAIVAARPLSSTGELAAVVRKAIGQRPGDKKDAATRTFQAIRIHINAELDELRSGLVLAEHMLKPGGRLAVVTFHSLEDRIVKQFLRERSGQLAGASRHHPQTSSIRSAPTFLKPAKAVRPTGAEQALNPRARSATLRSAVRSDAPAWDRPAAIGESRQ
jgi:16S rRNA (cytosine1402-N4)-methyltransferase